jgi:hypothetical protein
VSKVWNFYDEDDELLFVMPQGSLTGLTALPGGATGVMGDGMDLGLVGY